MDANKMQEVGEKMQAVGCLLTLLITIPVVLTIFLGPLGLGISAAIIIVWFLTKKKK